MTLTPMTRLAPIVANALQSLDGSFLPDELAYLALTQKVEHAIRDSLAFKLHQSIDGSGGLLVCREWNRTDLAIVERDQPRLLLEAKAIYTFDIVKTGAPHSYPDLLQQDIDKARRWRAEASSPDPEILALLVATHPHDSPSPRYRQAVKYHGGVTQYAIATNTIFRADQEVRRRIPFPVLAHGKLQGGNAFGVGVSVVYWLFQPKDDV